MNRKQQIRWRPVPTYKKKLSVLVGALKDLGRSLGQVLDAVATFAGEQIVKLMQAVRVIWTKIKDILEFIAQKAENTIQTLLVALLGTGLHLVKILECILKEVRAAFRQGLIKGLIQIGYSMLVLMVEAVKIGASMAAVLFSIFMDIFGSHRGLTAAERAEAEKVFGTSIELNKVRLTNASLPSDLIMWLNQNRPFTTMYVINYKSGTNLPIRTLIHELTHIWQAEKSGGVYMLEALHSQFFGKAYKLNDVDVIDAAGQLSNLEREQQAVLVEEYWRGQFNGESIPLTLDLIRPLARQVYESKLTVNPIRLTDFGVITNRVFNPVRPVVPQ